MNSLRLIIILVLTLFLGSVSVAPLVSAQSLLPRTSPTLAVTPGVAPLIPINLTVSPVSLALETDPGVPVQSQLRIRNNSSVAEQLKITVGSFTAAESGNQPRLIEPRESDVFLTWLKFDDLDFTAASNEWTTIPFRFEPPGDAALSYYYSVVISRSIEPVKTDGQAVVQGAPALLVLTTVNSPFAKKELRLTEFSVKNPVVEFLPQEFIAKIQNSGNVHLGPSGNVFIDAQTKKDIAVLSLNPASSLILPQATREFTVSWKDGFPLKAGVVDGDEKGEVGLEFWGIQFDFSKAHTFRMGQFTAHLLMVYDNGERDVPIESFVSFWVIPWRILLVALVVGIFVLLGLRSVLAPIFKPFLRIFKKKDTTA